MGMSHRCQNAPSFYYCPFCSDRFRTTSSVFSVTFWLLLAALGHLFFLLSPGIVTVMYTYTCLCPSFLLSRDLLSPCPAGLPRWKRWLARVRHERAFPPSICPVSDALNQCKPHRAVKEEHAWMKISSCLDPGITHLGHRRSAISLMFFLYWCDSSNSKIIPLHWMYNCLYC